MYSLGEESIHSLPKSMLKPDSKNRHQESQNDSVLCKTLFVSKSELDDLRTELLFKLSELKEEVITYTYSRCLEVVLLAGTNHLSDRRVTPEKLIDKLDTSLTELRQFSFQQDLIFKSLTIK